MPKCIAECYFGVVIFIEYNVTARKMLGLKHDFFSADGTRQAGGDLIVVPLGGEGIDDVAENHNLSVLRSLMGYGQFRRAINEQVIEPVNTEV